jgi:hypothetical protein
MTTVAMTAEDLAQLADAAVKEALSAQQATRTTTTSEGKGHLNVSYFRRV